MNTGYFVAMITILLSTCGDYNHNKNKIMNKTVLHIENKIFFQMEPIRVGVQLINASGKEAKIKNIKLDWEELSFSKPSFLHLINEKGEELALKYEKPVSYFEEIDPIIIPPINEEWFYFPLNTHFPKLQVGNYKLWLDITDSIGNAFACDTITFSVVHPEMENYSEKLDIKISMPNNEISDMEDLKVDVLFINNSQNKVTFLKPSFDSFYGWRNPTYYFVLEEKFTGRVVPLPLRSGTMEVPIFDDSLKFTIDPNSSEILVIQLPPYSKLSKPQDYTIQLLYLVRRNKIGKSGTILDEEMNWDENVFVGLIESNVINLK